MYENCGLRQGFFDHKKRKEEPCVLCKIANREYQTRQARIRRGTKAFSTNVGVDVSDAFVLAYCEDCSWRAMRDTEHEAFEAFGVHRSEIHNDNRARDTFTQRVSRATRKAVSV